MFQVKNRRLDGLDVWMIRKDKWRAEN